MDVGPVEPIVLRGGAMDWFWHAGGLTDLAYQRQCDRLDVYPGS
jgi:hypothetical protein